MAGCCLELHLAGCCLESIINPFVGALKMQLLQKMVKANYLLANDWVIVLTYSPRSVAPLSICLPPF